MSFWDADDPNGDWTAVTKVMVGGVGENCLTPLSRCSRYTVYSIEFAVCPGVSSTGAAPTKADKTEVEAIVQRVRQKKYGFKTLVHEVVGSGIFQSK
jgi:hypothetical protein